MVNDNALAVGGLCLVGAVVAAIALGLNGASYDVAVGAVVFVAIVVVSLPILRRVAEGDDDPHLFVILVVALLAKLVFSLVRYFVMYKAYGGLGDAARYDQDGWALAEAIRTHNPLPAFSEATGADETGTGRIVQLTGYVYVVIGRSRFGAYFIYSWMAFWGLLLFIRGAQWGFPEVDRRRLTLLVLFFPSLLFWPSSIGKDAVMVLMLGLVAYGAGRLLGPTPNLVGAVPFVAGMGGMLLVRPHIGLMAVLALAVAMGFSVLGGGRSAGASRSGRSALVRAIALVILVLGATVAATQTSRFFVEKSDEATSTTDAFDLTLQRSQVGGSKFDPVAVRTPADVPAAMVSVLYRPFLWEANNFGNAIAAGESILLLGLTVISWKRLRRWPGTAWRRPFVIFASVYIVMFVVAFSNIANAGILARQRSQMIPFLLLLLCIPVDQWWRRGDPELVAPSEPTWATPLGSRTGS